MSRYGIQIICVFIAYIEFSGIVAFSNNVRGNRDIHCAKLIILDDLFTRLNDSLAKARVLEEYHDTFGHLPIFKTTGRNHSQVMNKFSVKLESVCLKIRDVCECGRRSRYRLTSEQNSCEVSKNIIYNNVMPTRDGIAFYQGRVTNLTFQFERGQDYCASRQQSDKVLTYTSERNIAKNLHRMQHAVQEMLSFLKRVYDGSCVQQSSTI